MEKKITVHQFTAVYAEHDAVGHHTVGVDTILRDMGCDTLLFAEHTCRSSIINVKDIRSHKNYANPDILLYQMSTGSPVANYILTRTEPIILNYHNITPPRFFAAWAPHISYTLEEAREQLGALASRTSAAIADSHYNAEELYDVGISNVVVSPVISPSIIRSNNVELTHGETPLLLFVGRIVPNKRIEILISSLALLKTKWAKARLVIAGTPVVPSYDQALKELVARLELTDSVDFTGSIPSEDRDALYSNSTVYVSASLHEGFCVPLLEAMNTGLPVVAHKSTAVPETIGDAGMLVDSDGPLSFAKAVDMILSDHEVRMGLVSRGLKRASHFAPNRVKMQMRDALESILENI